jgi:WXG100 family type VII secretion target
VAVGGKITATLSAIEQAATRFTQASNDTKKSIADLQTFLNGVYPNWTDSGSKAFKGKMPEHIKKVDEAARTMQAIATNLRNVKKYYEQMQAQAASRFK